MIFLHVLDIRSGGRKGVPEKQSFLRNWVKQSAEGMRQVGGMEEYREYWVITMKKESKVPKGRLRMQIGFVYTFFKRLLKISDFLDGPSAAGKGRRDDYFAFRKTFFASVSREKERERERGGGGIHKRQRKFATVIRRRSKPFGLLPRPGVAPGPRHEIRPSGVLLSRQTRDILPSRTRFWALPPCPQTKMRSRTLSLSFSISLSLSFSCSLSHVAVKRKMN